MHSIIAFRVPNKWGLVSGLNHSWHLRRLILKRILILKILIAIVNTAGVAGGLYSLLFFYVRPQVFPPHPHPVILTYVLHTSGFSRVAYLLQPSIDLASCQIRKQKREEYYRKLPHFRSSFWCAILFTKDAVIFSRKKLCRQGRERRMEWLGGGFSIALNIPNPI